MKNVLPGLVVLMILSNINAENEAVSLFDGTTGAGWVSAGKDSFPAKGWEITDGILTVLGKGGGDIVTTRVFTNFVLELECRLTPGANSGIKYLIQDSNPHLGLEYQILDDARHPDAKNGSEGNHTHASLYDLIPAADKTPAPVGQWDKIRLVVDGAHVEHWLNGKKVVEFNRDTPEFLARVAKSKYRKNTGFGTYRSGRILLQDHGDTVSFRNIRIRVL